MFKYIAIISTISITVCYHCGEEWSICLGWKMNQLQMLWFMKHVNLN